MSAHHRLPVSLDRLTDKELEILRLLAAGHTVKSIAARLGRSETSINERLRDARRKTGVGSSRELARLLDTQKNWDNKFDLSRQGSSFDEPLPPACDGRRKSKGIKIMLITMPVVALGLVIMSEGSMDQSTSPPVAYAAASLQIPLVGKWALDVDRIPAGERPRRVTFDFRVAPDDRWTTHVEIVAPDGSVQHAESTAMPNGKPAPISGNMDLIDTVSLRRPATDTLVMTLGKNGAPVSTRVYTVAKDGKSMTETIIWANNGIPKLETTHFNRVL
ncbi:helix-turn-helix transcriptional regulator [Novosphingobium aquae]|uniref:Helix-turn-helix transcriptional regulator n=1 Tax=Novosphingobium aquae TaxID=3133435 RepID=A0ABU8S9Q1_9SPHN